MKYGYNIDKGVIRYTPLSSKIAATLVAAFVLAFVFTATVFAGKPANPGCFGQDRATYNKTVAQASNASPGASETGHILADRGSENGEINRDYKSGCGGDPSQL